MAQATMRLEHGEAVRRVPPQSVEAEIAVLGGILLDNEAVNRALEILQPIDFYKDSHRKIFEAMVAIADRQEPVDLLTLAEELSRRGQTDVVGGEGMLASLADSVPTAANIAYYARIVKEKATLRNVISAATEIISETYTSGRSSDQLLDSAERRIFDIAQRRINPSFYAIKDIVKDSFKAIERLYESPELITGVPSGFRELDKLTAGFQRGELIVIAGRPSMGKTALALNIAQHAAISANLPVAAFSLEMTKEQLVLRLLCSEAKVDSHRLRGGYLGEGDWPKLTRAAGSLSEAPIYIDDTQSLTVLQMKAKARRLKADSKHGLELLIVDYLQLMQGSGGSERREQEISEITRSLKALAKELNIPVVALSQLRRAAEDRPGKRPQLADLRECVTGDTLVMLADGRRLPIASLVGKTPEVLAVSSEGRIAAAKSEKVWKVGLRPVFEILLASGRSIRATAGHRLYGFSGWVRVSKLRPNDRLALARALPVPRECDRWSEFRVALLAHLIGDGSYLSHQPLRYTTASEENSRIVSEAAKSEFGVAVTRHMGRGQWHQLVFSGNGDRWHPAGLNRWLRELGTYGQRSHEKRVPEQIFRLSNEQIGLFLQHLWATDGSIWPRGAGSRGASRVYFSTNSRGLAFDVAALLLRFGIVARLRTVHQKGYRPMHTVDISGADAQRRFLASVGSFGPRRVPAGHLATRLARKVGNTNVDTLPVEVFSKVRAVMGERGVSQRAMASLRGTSYGGLSHFRFAPSRAVVAQYAELLESEDLRQHAAADLFWDRIIEIRPAGEEETYDLTVPGFCSWLGDGIVSHNSGAIEQDADVVIFIYRDEVYNPESDEKGIARIILSKQRNGPTGDLKLTYLDKYTAFANYSPEVAEF